VDEKPYAKLFKGMALFDKYHHMAPAAALRCASDCIHARPVSRSTAWS